MKKLKSSQVGPALRQFKSQGPSRLELGRQELDQSGIAEVVHNEEWVFSLEGIKGKHGNEIVKEILESIGRNVIYHGGNDPAGNTQTQYGVYSRSTGVYWLTDEGLQEALSR